jgi:WD40 repeat protein
MAHVRFYHLFALMPLLWTGAARAEDTQAPPQLYDQPVLVIDPGTHTAVIANASADRDGRRAVTGSPDKTVRIWSLADGELERTIRLPAGPGNIGEVYAVAMSPDGVLIAAGGRTRWTNVDSQEQIYLFDRASGTLVKRIEGLPDEVHQLVFSPDGNRLAAGLGHGGLRVYAREGGWDEVAHDEDYHDGIFGADFAPDGRIATTSRDGRLRLYAPSAAGAVRPVLTVEAPSGKQPFGIAFSPPDGACIAVGYIDIPRVDLLDGHDLTGLTIPEPMGIQDVDGLLGFLAVAWSRDGEELLASGMNVHPASAVLAWNQRGRGPHRLLAKTNYPVRSLIALNNGDLLTAGTRLLARLGPDSTPHWARLASTADFIGQTDLLKVSTDGMRVGFGYEQFGGSAARFDVATRTLVLGPETESGMTAPRLTGMDVENWRDHWGDKYSPMIDGRPLSFEPYEISRSLAIHPAGKSFVLGTSMYLRAYDAQGASLWTHHAPGEVRAVNIAGDGRLVVAAYDDGTIRWHRMTDGAELIAFMPLADRVNWVAWTPEGYYAASPGARGVLRWHVNRGWDQPADSVPVEDIPGSYRPDVLPLVLQELETKSALGLAELAVHNREVMLRTHGAISPGARLYLLSVGIDEYNEENLRLRFADRDAQGLASAIINTQDKLYDVKPTVLLDKDATKTGILRALKTMRAGMTKGTGTDLAVIYFSGHGAMVENKLYLLPYDVDTRDDAGIESNGLWVEELKGELTELGQHGHVLVLLDACHSGATSTAGSPLSMDSTALRTALASANVSVLTSSSGAEVSIEVLELQHGAFTKALLDALDDPAADIDRSGLITPSGLEHYVANRVPMLTGDKQHPGMEVRYDTTLFARSR